MSTKKKGSNKTLGFILLSFVLVLVVAINVTCGILFELITNYLCGSGVEISGEQAEAALAASDELCRDIAEEGVVLVQNKDQTLPMLKSEFSQVNVFGWRATNAGWLGGSSGSVNANNNSVREKIKSILTVLEENGMEYNTEIIDMYEKFCSVGDGKALNDGEAFFKLKQPTIDAFTPQMIQNAKDFSDVAIVVLGRQGGEGQDLPKWQWNWKTDVKDTTRNYLDTMPEEDALLEMVSTNFEKVIVIVTSNNGFNYSFLEKYEGIDACLWSSGTGQSGANSIFRMLRGKVTPSAKFTTTQPYEFNTDPTYMNHPDDASGHITYAENIYVGYRWYETADKMGYWNSKTLTLPTVKADGTAGANFTATGYDAVVQFPFGYGLSYTEFEWEVEDAPTVTTSFDGKKEISVQVTVTNVGERKGKDVVQLYVTPPYTNGGIEKSHVNLVAYAKTDLLLAGDSETVELKFNPYDAASFDCYDKNNNGFRGYELEKGDYVLSVRTDAHTLASCENAEMTYNLANDVRFEKDPVTGNDVVARFTRSGSLTPYGNNAIDGSDADQADVTYLSRADFAGTYPTAKSPNRSGSSVSAGANYVYHDTSITTAPTTGDGSAGELLLYRTESGGAATQAQLKNGEGLVMNTELMLELGGDYNNPKWNQLLNQLSISDMHTLVRLGGYCTREIVSIGKKYMLDNDGGSGLNRHIQESDAGSGYDSSKRSSWTLFPCTNMLGASWNNQLAYAYGLAIANEGIATGIDGWYSPSCNMLRSPFDGRVSEYVSEDAILSGYITAYQVKGAMANGMYTYVKHFAANETETGREGLNTWLTEQSFRENYLRAFEITVKVGDTCGIMSSFNRIGSNYAARNKALLTDILRTEWGFKGAVITDWSGGGGVPEGLPAGQDLWLTGAGTCSTDFANNAEYLTYARQACKNIIYMKARAYYVNQNHDDSMDTIKADASIVVVRDIPFPWWTIILGAIDVIAVAGLTVWFLFLVKPELFKKKGKKAQGGIKR